jgi:hypothetical protein
MSPHRWPAAVEQRLIDAGHITVDGISRQARTRRCRRCQAVTLVGLDHPRVATRACVDMAILDQLGEAVALIGGRPTYELWGRELLLRCPIKIRAGMAKPVLAEHLCGEAPVPSPEVLDVFYARPRITDDKDAPCPF